MPKTHRIAAISGSLREGSYNTALLRAAIDLKPETLQVDIVTLHDVPLFSEDVEARGWPPPVEKLRDRIAAADGLIPATPEYNYSVPGVLKNAIDWLSRPEGDSPIFGKPVAIIGASISRIGTARAQAHLRSIAFYNGLPLLPTSEVLVAKAQEKFDEKGNLTDEDTKYFMRDMLAKLADWVTLHRQGSAPS